MNINQSIQYLKGVGPKRAKKLSKLNIKTIEDLLYYFPRTYEDRRSITKIKDCKNKEKVTLDVVVTGSPVTLRPRKGMSITKIPVKDETGIAYMVYYNQPYIVKSLKEGTKIKINGRVNISYGQIQIQSPIFNKGKDNSKIGNIVPIYPLTDKLSNNEIIKMMKNALNNYLDSVDEVFTIDMRKKLDLSSIEEALMNIHFPEDREGYKSARKRLVFEEFLILQLALLTLKSRLKNNNKGIIFPNKSKCEEFVETLPFTLTNAQSKVFEEINKDMESEKSMNRLVQGDVGSGKTVIAIMAMLKAVFSGYQSVMMAPTEILATQHYHEINHLLKNFNINCKLLVGSLSSKEKNKILEEIKIGNIDILVGTHALIQEQVNFNKLGLAITDEQHRFGVRQRAKLSEKGHNPDVLVMTATPIPRTLAMILYGDLDISIIDELPPGRKKIETYSVNKSMKQRVFNFIEKQIVEGRQAYLVSPLVEESDTLDIQSATELYEEIQDRFHNTRVALLHGKMKPKEKEMIMKSFKNGDIDILVSTTVIEVGVNVPNANIMVIMNSERFGLAQLHQLRGRVGRGEYKSYCILINEGKNKIARERMRIMEKTSNGFIISEKDLELRGPGEFFGTRQHGLPEFKIANVFTDMDILKFAQKVAIKILEEDSNLTNPKYIKIRNKSNKLIQNNLKDISLN